MIKDKATELLGGAGEKVGDLTGIDLPVGEAAGQVAQSAADVTETGQGLVDTAGARGTEILDATGTVGDAIDPNLRS